MASRQRIAVVLALVVMTLVAGCSADDPGEPQAAHRAASASDAPSEHDVLTTQGPMPVIGRDGVVRLCLGFVYDTFPPQCGGSIVIDGWNWESAGPYQEAYGVRWGDYVVTGEIVPGREHLSIVSVPPADLESDAPSYSEAPAVPCDASKHGTSTAGPVRSEQETVDLIDELDGFTGVAAVFQVDETRFEVVVAHDRKDRLQRELNERYGCGVVKVTSILVPR